ncbi:hypothetical protein [Proteiniborus sp. MB09-C3]|nr:hypothetical protein [Proteiniborus sp. MB09-C3]WIV11075.1 hypothetical protein QO263_13060 [Proteiniborus sp. MB09-C3]
MSENTKIILEENFQNNDDKKRKIKFNEIIIKLIKKKEEPKLIN